jgi:hypothetical protein
VLILLNGCGRPQTAPAESWDQFRDGFLEAYFHVRPDVAVNEGRHEFDGKLPDFSKQAIDAEIGRLHGQRERAATFSSGLTDAQRLERDYLIATIDGSLFWMETAQWPYRDPYWYNDALDPAVYLTRPYAPLPQRMRAFVEYEKALPATLQQVRQNLRTPMAKTWIDQGRLQYGGLATYFEHDVPAIFASVKEPALRLDFVKANGNAIKALQALDAWFEAQRATATDNVALGADNFQKMLHATERVDMPLDRLQAVGQRDLDRNLAAMKEACSKFVPGKSLVECVAKEESDKPKLKPVEAAREQLKELRAFVIAKNVVTIPGTEEALVDEAPPYARWNFAYINIAGPYEKGLPSVYYISPPDPKWSAAEQRAYIPGKAKLLFNSVHEVMPGHFVQFLHANRSSSKFGQVFVGYAFAEGWAHYCEEMMWEAGLGDGDPETHVGQIQQALLRDVRLLSAIGMHTGKMTVADSEKMFREAALSDTGNARQQAARGTFDPAYLNYTMGKLMIRKLRDDWTGSRGGRSAWHDFHDQFLQYGGPPIPLVREAMMGANAGAPL